MYVTISFIENPSATVLSTYCNCSPSINVPDVWDMVNSYGRDVLMSLATDEDAAMRRAIEAREAERPTRQEEGPTFEEREAEAERVDEMMADLRAGRTVRR